MTNSNKDKKVIAVWFSNGAASAVAAKLTIELYGNSHTIRVLNNPVDEEHPDNLRFLKDCEKWLSVEIERVVNTKVNTTSANEIWKRNKFMSGTWGAPCTAQLKRKARQEWELNNDFDSIVLGFTLDEIQRHERFIAIEPYPVIPVLIDAGITKQDCFQIIKEAGIEVPYIYKLGFPNANCIGCVKASSATYWNLVRREFPEIFKERAELSREIGCKLTYLKGKKIFLDELPENAKGNKLKSWDCGTFCESD